MLEILTFLSEVVIFDTTIVRATKPILKIYLNHIALFMKRQISMIQGLTSFAVK